MFVVIAEKEELRLVEELGFMGYPIIITGVGGMNVIKALKDLPKDAEIVNIGYCGSKKLEIGKKIMVDCVHTYNEIANFYDSGVCNTNNKFGKYPFFDCYTSTDFVTSTTIKTPCVFDMELAFIRAMFDNVISIKEVSDNLNKKEYDKKLKKS